VDIVLVPGIFRVDPVHLKIFTVVSAATSLSKITQEQVKKNPDFRITF
jgi:hypothetical protein